MGRCPDAHRAIAYYRLRHSFWLHLRGIERKITVTDFRAPHGCPHAKWVAHRWQKKAAAAREAYYRWRENHWTLRAHNTWRESVNEAQKAFPGTGAWLMSCSSTEGGHGAFIQNRDGANVWGWVQMHPDTFHRFWVRGWYDPARGRSYIGAYDWLVKQGFSVQAPRSGSSISNPLAHALAAAYSLVNGRRGEYHSSGCR